MKKFFNCFLILMVFLLCSCQSQLLIGKGKISLKLPGLSSARAAEDDITLTYTIDCFVEGSDTAKYSTTGEAGETVSFSDVEPAAYKVVVQAYNADKTDELLYKGEGSALVMAGETSSVSIILKYVGPEELEEELPEEITVTIPNGKNTVSFSLKGNADKTKLILEADPFTEEGVKVTNYYWLLDGKLLPKMSGADKSSYEVNLTEDFNYSIEVVAEFSNNTYDMASFSMFTLYKEGNSKVTDETSYLDLWNKNMKELTVVPSYAANEKISKGYGKLNYTVNFFDYTEYTFNNEFAEDLADEEYAEEIKNYFSNDVSVETTVYPIKYLSDSDTKAVKTIQAEKSSGAKSFKYINNDGIEEKLDIPVYKFSVELEEGWYVLKTDFNTNLKLNLPAGGFIATSSGAWCNVIYIGEQYESSLERMEYSITRNREWTDIAPVTPEPEKKTITVEMDKEAYNKNLYLSIYEAGDSLLTSDGKFYTKAVIADKTTYDNKVCVNFKCEKELNSAKTYIVEICGLSDAYNSYYLECGPEVREDSYFYLTEHSVEMIQITNVPYQIARSLTIDIIDPVTKETVVKGIKISRVCDGENEDTNVILFARVPLTYYKDYLVIVNVPDNTDFKFSYAGLYDDTYTNRPGSTEILVFVYELDDDDGGNTGGGTGGTGGGTGGTGGGDVIIDEPVAVITGFNSYEELAAFSKNPVVETDKNLTITLNSCSEEQLSSVFEIMCDNFAGKNVTLDLQESKITAIPSNLSGIAGLTSLVLKLPATVESITCQPLITTNTKVYVYAPMSYWYSYNSVNYSYYPVIDDDDCVIITVATDDANKVIYKFKDTDLVNDYAELAVALGEDNIMGNHESVAVIGVLRGDDVDIYNGDTITYSCSIPLCLIGIPDNWGYKPSMKSGLIVQGTGGTVTKINIE